MPTRDYPTKNDVSHIVTRGYSSRMIPRLSDIVLRVASWNTADSAANIVVGDNGYSARYTGTPAPPGSLAFSIRANRYIDSSIPGKYYLEVRRTTPQGSQPSGFGFANISESTSNFPGSTTNSIGFFFPNTVWYNNAAIATLNGAYVLGDAAAIAVDTTSSPYLWWVRYSPTGQWNLSPTANPATGVGGIAQTVNGSLFPIASFIDSGGALFTNFGETAFAGFVPAGFGPVVAANSILADVPNGTTLALIDVLESGVAFPTTGSLALSGVDAASYQINGKRLQNAATIQRGSTSISITADTLVFRTANNPLTKPFNLTAVGGLGMNFSPPSPSWPSTTPNGTVVATLQGFNHDGRPYTGDYVFIPPNFSNGGTYDIVLNGDHSGSLRTAPSGPGVSGAGGTIQHVTVAPRE